MKWANLNVGNRSGVQLKNRDDKNKRPNCGAQPKINVWQDKGKEYGQMQNYKGKNKKQDDDCLQYSASWLNLQLVCTQTELGDKGQTGREHSKE